MARRKIIAGNWKMNMTPSQAVALIEELKPYNIPVFFNVNFGHSYPHAIIPYGALAELDADNKTIKILDNIIE